MTVIAIDLGTAHTRVAVWQDGMAKILKNELGNRVTPSCVAFNNLERFVGDAAKNQMAMNAPNTVYDVKRLLGRKFSDPQVKADLPKWPFEISARHHNFPKIDISIFGRPDSLSPEEVMAMILAKAKDIGEAHLKQPVAGAVITVPAMFGSVQRKAVLDAAQIAGLKVLRLINETTAAALAYGMEYAVQNKQIVFFYHLGAGAFDVAIVEITNGRQFSVLGVEGNSCLGGIDFDDRLVQHFAREFERDHETDIRSNAKAMRRLRTACEGVKKVLSTNFEAIIEVDSLCGGIDFSSSITRNKFDEICKDLFEETFNSVSDLLHKLDMTKSQIDEVFLVGGSTRIPKFAVWLEDYFGGTKLNYTMNAEEIVISGAAAQVAMLTEDRFKNMKLKDMASLPFHVKYPTKTPFPLTIQLQQTVTQEFEVSADFSFLIFSETKNTTFFEEYFSIRGIPEFLEEVIKVKIKISLDVNGVLTVTASEYAQSTSICENFVKISDDDMSKAKYNLKHFAEIDVENTRRKKARVKFENAILVLEQKLKSIGLPDGETSKLRKYCADELEWLGDNLNASLDTVERRDVELHETFNMFISKYDFIACLDRLASESKDLPEISRNKMNHYLEKNRKWIANQDTNTFGWVEIKRRMDDLQKRFEEASLEHRKTQKDTFNNMLGTLHYQINRLSNTYGEQAAKEMGQLYNEEKTWLNSHFSVSGQEVKKRSVAFSAKQKALLVKFKEQRACAAHELKTTCHSVMNSAMQQRNTRGSAIRKKEIKQVCEETLAWLDWDKPPASVQEMKERKAFLTGLLKCNENRSQGLVATMIEKWNTFSITKIFK